MGTISVSLPSDGTTADVADYNNPINTIVNEFNGNIDNSNIASGAAIAGSKIASGTITSSQINFGGSGAGIWWEEIGRTKLSSAADSITVASLAARTYLRVLVYLIPTGGSITGQLQFNGDATNNYSRRTSTNGAADVATPSQGSLSTTGLEGGSAFVEFNVINVAAQEKLVMGHTFAAGSAGAASSPTRYEGFGKWANTSAQISQIAFNNTGTGDYATNSEVIVLGHN